MSTTATTAPTYWLSQAVTIDWHLTDLDGQPTDATVTATVTAPDGTTEDPVAEHVATGHYRAVYDPAQPGTHAYRLVATGALDAAEEGTFYVRPTLAPAAPITTDPATDVGYTRQLAADLDPDAPLFTDAQWQGFLDREGAVKLAAAAGLEAVARSEALVAKVIRTQDLSTDGAKLAAELRASAAELRRQAAEETSAAADATGDGDYGVVDLGGARWPELVERPYS